jgi:hypothetical protein
VKCAAPRLARERLVARYTHEPVDDVGAVGECRGEDRIATNPSVTARRKLEEVIGGLLCAYAAEVRVGGQCGGRPT